MKTLRRKSVSITNSRWAAYATAGAATALAGVNSAEADIHYSGVLNTSFANLVSTFYMPATNPNDFFVLGQGYRAGTPSIGFAGFYVKGAVSAMFRGVAGSGVFRYPSKLASNQMISAGPFAALVAGRFATLASNNGYGGSQWLAAGTGFIGFKFNGGSVVQYGWVRITMNGAPGNGFTLVDYAWADAGTAIKTGQTAIPEPGSLGLLALGAAGLLVWRRSRAKAA